MLSVSMVITYINDTPTMKIYFFYFQTISKTGIRVTPRHPNADVSTETGARARRSRCSAERGRAAAAGGAH